MPNATSRRPRLSESLAALLLTALSVTGLALSQPLAASAQDEDESYGYVRSLEGRATLIPAPSVEAYDDRDRSFGDAGERLTDIEINQPLLRGDRLSVPRGSRLEAVLPDGNLLRLDGGSEVLLKRLAGSADAGDDITLLELDAGNLQLVVSGNALGAELPRVDTPNATVYVQEAGRYRLSFEQGSWTSLVVREGAAEVVTERDSAQVESDEEALVEGERLARIEVQPAGSRDGLERWAERLDAEGDRLARDGDFQSWDDRLRYQAAPLSRYGSWVNADNRRLWRPRVDPGWQPYSHGRWTYTPSGLTWVAYEPWGWVPYHYGTWDYLPAYGWVWEPGRVYSPAWVYWYWGPSQVGWCPVGYYTRYYGRHHGGFRSGVYGWAGGTWDHFDRWSFVSIDHFGRRDQHRWSRRGRDFGSRGTPVPRGIITTDTSRITPNRWRRPNDVMRELEQRRPHRDRELPDVTSFVARQPRLPEGVLRTVIADRPGTMDGGAPLAPMIPPGPRAERPRPRPQGDGGGMRSTTGGPSRAPQAPKPAEPTYGETWRPRQPAPAAPRPGVKPEDGAQAPGRPRVWDRPQRQRPQENGRPESLPPAERYTPPPRESRPAPPPPQEPRRPERPERYERPQRIAPPSYPAQPPARTRPSAPPAEGPGRQAPPPRARERQPEPPENISGGDSGGSERPERKPRPRERPPV